MFIYCHNNALFVAITVPLVEHAVAQFTDAFRRSIKNADTVRFNKLHRGIKSDSETPGPTNAGLNASANTLDRL